MKINRSNIVSTSLITAVGFTAITGQLSLVRLTAQSFYGNELTMCIALGHWLMWTGIGSLLGSRLLKKRNFQPDIFRLSIFYCISLLLSSVLLFFIRKISGIGLSEMVGLGRIFFWTILIFFIPSTLNGLFFPFLVHWTQQRTSSAAVHRVYIGEVLGSAIGGIVFILLIQAGLNTFYVLNISIGILMTICLVIFLESRLKAFVVFILIGLFNIVFATILFPKFISMKWFPYQVNSFSESPHLAITELEYGESRVIFGDSEPIWTYDVEENAEDLVHFAMLNHPQPASVLIIGIGNSDIYTQLKKYPTLKSITVIQTDEILQKIIDSSGDTALSYDNIQIIIADPMQSLKYCREKYDVVFLNTPLPVNAMWNRFYTIEFFRILKNVLKQSGIVSLSFPGSETYLSPNHGGFLKTMENTASKVFRSVCWIPGETVHLLASDSLVQNDYNFINERIKATQIKTNYVRDYYLKDRLSEQKIRFLSASINAGYEKRVNRLLKPVGYFYNTILWDQSTDGWLKSIYLRLDKIGPLFPGIAAIVLVSGLLIGIRIRRKASYLLKFNMAVIGFCVMSLETVLSILLQSYVGGLYLKIALITLLFMFGAGAGAIVHRRYFGGPQLRQFIFLAFVLIAICMATIFLMSNFSRVGFVAPLIFGLVLCCGVISGINFPLLSMLMKKFSDLTSARSAGNIYAWDIIGSCFGVYFTSGLIIPVFGLLTAVIGLVVLLVITALNSIMHDCR